MKNKYFTFVNSVLYILWMVFVLSILEKHEKKI